MSQWLSQEWMVEARFEPKQSGQENSSKQIHRGLTAESNWPRKELFTHNDCLPRTFLRLAARLQLLHSAPITETALNPEALSSRWPEAEEDPISTIPGPCPRGQSMPKGIGCAGSADRWQVHSWWHLPRSPSDRAWDTDDLVDDPGHGAIKLSAEIQGTRAGRTHVSLNYIVIFRLAWTT